MYARSGPHTGLTFQKQPSATHGCWILTLSVKNFLHNAKFNIEKSQIEMYLESTVEHSIKLPNNEHLNIGKGEKILTEISRKFSEKTLIDLFNKSSLDIIKSYTDKKKYFSIYLLKSRKYS